MKTCFWPILVLLCSAVPGSAQQGVDLNGAVCEWDCMRQSSGSWMR